MDINRQPDYKQEGYYISDNVTIEKFIRISDRSGKDVLGKIHFCIVIDGKRSHFDSEIAIKLINEVNPKE